MSFDITELVKSVPNRDSSREQIEYIPLEKLLPDADNFYSMAGIEELALRCSFQKSRTVGTFRKLDYEDMLQIYRAANG